MRVVQGNHHGLGEASSSSSSSSSSRVRGRYSRARREPHASCEPHAPRVRAGGRRRGRSAPPRRGLAAALALAALTGALAGCGSSAPTGTNADPAGAVPASAPVYVGAVVRPGGSLKTEALAAGRGLTHQPNPYTRLLGVLQTPGSPTLDFSREVAPWLGERAGLFFTALGSSEALTTLLVQGLTGSGSGALWPFGASGGTAGAGGGGGQGAIVLDTSDLAAAQKFVATQASRASAHASSYKGVSFQVTAGGDAFAVIDKLVVLGSEAGMRAVIDTTQGGATLKANASYTQLQSVAPSGTLWHVYTNPSALTKAHIAGASGGATVASLPALLSVPAGTRPLNVSLVPGSKSLAFDADVGPAPAGATGAQSGGLVAAAAAGNRALGELPGESWLAAGVGNVGAAGSGLRGIRELLSLASTLGTTSAGEGASSPQATFSVTGLLEGLLTPLKALSANTPRAKREFLSWMGEAGVFASGASVLELKAAVTIDSTDPAASRAAVGALAASLRKSGAEATPATIPGTEAAVEAKITGLPVTLVIADGRAANGHAKFVLGLGETSIQAALNPPSTMSGAAGYSAAQTALGEGIEPSIVVSFPTLVSLLEGVGLTESPPVSTFIPFLRNSTTLAGGGKSLGGGIERLRLVLGLQPSSG
jgi:Protein of unknown function (DUF3352)